MSATPPQDIRNRDIGRLITALGDVGDVTVKTTASMDWAVVVETHEGVIETGPGDLLRVLGSATLRG